MEHNQNSVIVNLNELKMHSYCPSNDNDYNDGKSDSVVVCIYISNRSSMLLFSERCGHVEFLC